MPIFLGPGDNRYVWRNAGAGAEIYGEGGKDTIYGNNANDLIDGGENDDLLLGKRGGDVLYGQTGDDFVFGGAGSDIIYGGDGNDNLNGNDNLAGDDDDGADYIDAGIGKDILTGGSGDDTLTAIGNDGFGYDRYSGGLGNDTYIINGGNFSIGAEFAGQGVDLIVIDVGLDLTKLIDREIENLTLTGVSAINGGGNALENIVTGNEAANRLLGREGDDTLSGNGGNDILQGDSGADRMVGGSGNDTYIVDSNLDLTLETSNAGTDTIESNVDLSLATRANIENLVLTGLAVSGVGNDINNQLTGTELKNTLNGAGGFDVLTGGLGDDTYVLKDVATFLFQGNLIVSGYDSVVEQLSGGTDTVLVGRQADPLIFNGFRTSYQLGANIEVGKITGTGDFDLTGNGLDNELWGNGAANTLVGAGGSDSMIGGGGYDHLQGGVESDVYSLLDAGTVYINGNPIFMAYDEVVEIAGGGDFDLILIAPTSGALGVLDSYQMPDNVERLFITGTGTFTVTGNAEENDINGNFDSNALLGGVGMVSDFLYGNAGNDYLDGGEFADLMEGGAGDDIMIVDHALDQAKGGSGIDRVDSYVSWTLYPDVENLVLYGATDIDGTGNSRANVINGNNGGNVLSGLNGDDWLLGYTADDTLNGGAGQDKLDGGIGRDTLTGGGGGDTFDYNAITDSTVAVEDRDTIADFNFSVPGAIDPADIIDLADIDANAKVNGNDAFAFIGDAAFTALGQIRVTQSNGKTFIDMNTMGSTAVDMRIVLTGLHTMLAGDFVL